VEFERTQGAKSYLDLIRDGNPRRVFLGMSLQMWSQLSGMNVMMYYIVYVFQGAGLTGTRGNLIASVSLFAWFKCINLIKLTTLSRSNMFLT
jgi:hypothetical protein